MGKFTKEQIEERKARSTAKLVIRRVEEEERQLSIKEGVAFVHENRISIVTKKLDAGILAIGALKLETGKFRFGFALCAPQDVFSLKTCKGLIGKRLETQDPMFSFELDDLKNEDIRAVLIAGLIGIQLEAVKGNRFLPDRLRRAFTDEFEPCNEHWSLNFFGRD